MYVRLGLGLEIISHFAKVPGDKIVNPCDTKYHHSYKNKCLEI